MIHTRETLTSGYVALAVASPLADVAQLRGRQLREFVSQVVLEPQLVSHLVAAAACALLQLERTSAVRAGALDVHGTPAPSQLRLSDVAPFAPTLLAALSASARSGTVAVAGRAHPAVSAFRTAVLLADAVFRRATPSAEREYVPVLIVEGLPRQQDEAVVVAVVVVAVVGLDAERLEVLVEGADEEQKRFLLVASQIRVVVEPH